MPATLDCKVVGSDLSALASRAVLSALVSIFAFMSVLAAIEKNVPDGIQTMAVSIVILPSCTQRR
jgi:hypothetical protein